MTSLVLVTAPSAEPVTLEEAKSHLRVINDDDNSYIQDLIKVARLYLDGDNGVLGRVLITQTWDLTLPRFPVGDLPLPLPDLQSITSITYIDTDGAAQTLATSVYEADTGENMLRLSFDQVYPATRSVYNAVVIKFKAGYGDASADVPEGIRQAILLMVSHFYEVRLPVSVGSVANVVPFTVDSLIAPYKVSWV